MKKIIFGILIALLLVSPMQVKAATTDEITALRIKILEQIIALLEQEIQVLLAQQTTPVVAPQPIQPVTPTPVAQPAPVQQAPQAPIINQQVVNQPTSNQMPSLDYPYVYDTNGVKVFAPWWSNVLDKSTQGYVNGKVSSDSSNLTKVSESYSSSQVCLPLSGCKLDPSNYPGQSFLISQLLATMMNACVANPNGVAYLLAQKLTTLSVEPFDNNGQTGIKLSGNISITSLLTVDPNTGSNALGLNSGEVSCPANYQLN